MNEIDIFVGTRLREFREARRFSLERLGAAVGVSYQQIQKYEQGKNRVSASMLWRLTGVLHVGIEDVFPIEHGNIQSRDIVIARSLDKIDLDVYETVVDLIDSIAHAGKRASAPSGTDVAEFAEISRG